MRERERVCVCPNHPDLNGKVLVNSGTHYTAAAKELIGELRNAKKVLDDDISIAKSMKLRPVRHLLPPSST